MHPVFSQAIYYGVVMVLSMFLVGGIQKGFFWKYLKVRASFGKFILIKLREINRDFYRVGKIEEGMLVYNLNKKTEKRLVIPKEKICIYTSLGINMIDVDSQKNAICTVNYEAVTGFDAAKYSSLYTRALYKPEIADNKDKMIIAGIFLVAILVAGVLFGLKIQGQEMASIKATLDTINKGLITVGGGL